MTAEPDCGESLGEMMLVFPVILSTRVAQNMENYHTSAWRGREKPQSIFWSSTGRWKSWESPTAVQLTKPSKYFAFWSERMGRGVQAI